MVVLENYLYMMLSEGKMTSYLQLALIHSDEQRHVRSWSYVAQKYLITLFPFTCFRLTLIVCMRGVSKKGKMKAKFRTY